MEKNRLFFKQAMTLVEILIALGIIGVISALTITILINNYEKAQTATALEKAFNTLSNAMKKSEIDNGPATSWYLAAEWSSKESIAFWKTYFIPYLSINKTCSADEYTECWASNNKYLDGTSLSRGSSFGPYVLLSDGTAIFFGGICNSYGIIDVDINGFKNPNVFGKDIFEMILYYPIDKLVFNGCGNCSRTTILSKDYDRTCNKSPGSNRGIYCGQLIQKDGWKIANDYPW